MRRRFAFNAALAAAALFVAVPSAALATCPFTATATTSVAFGTLFLPGGVFEVETGEVVTITAENVPPGYVVTVSTPAGVVVLANNGAATATLQQSIAFDGATGPNAASDITAIFNPAAGAFAAPVTITAVCVEGAVGGGDVSATAAALVQNNFLGLGADGFDAFGVPSFAPAVARAAVANGVADPLIDAETAAEALFDSAVGNSSGAVFTDAAVIRFLRDLERIAPADKKPDVLALSRDFFQRASRGDAPNAPPAVRQVFIDNFIGELDHLLNDAFFLSGPRDEDGDRDEALARRLLREAIEDAVEAIAAASRLPQEARGAAFGRAAAVLGQRVFEILGDTLPDDENLTATAFNLLGGLTDLGFELAQIGVAFASPEDQALIIDDLVERILDAAGFTSRNVVLSREEREALTERVRQAKRRARRAANLAAGEPEDAGLTRFDPDFELTEAQEARLAELVRRLRFGGVVTEDDLAFLRDLERRGEFTPGQVTTRLTLEEQAAQANDFARRLDKILPTFLDPTQPAVVEDAVDEAIFDAVADALNHRERLGKPASREITETIVRLIIGFEVLQGRQSSSPEETAERIDRLIEQEFEERGDDDPFAPIDSPDQAQSFLPGFSLGESQAAFTFSLDAARPGSGLLSDPRLEAWAEGRAAWTRDGRALIDQSGTDLSIAAGARYRVTPDTALGGALRYRRIETDGIGADFEVDAYALGLFAQHAGPAGLRFETIATLEHGDVDAAFAAVGRADLDVNAVIIEAAAAKRFDVTAWPGGWAEPRAALVYANARLDDSETAGGAAIAAATQERGALELGAAAGATFDLNTGAILSLRPTAEATMIWNFLQPDDLAFAASAVAGPQFGARLSAGIEARAVSGLTFSLDGRFEAFEDGQERFGAALNISIPLN